MNTTRKRRRRREKHAHVEGEKENPLTSYVHSDLIPCERRKREREKDEDLLSFFSLVSRARRFSPLSLWAM